MQLEFGGGQPQAILNLATGQVEFYNEAGLEGNPFHARLGGRQYYASLSGLSGAGWISDRADIRPVTVLRSDISRPKVPGRVETLPGIQVVAFSRHLERAQDVSLLVVRGREVTVVWEHHLRNELLGTLEGTEDARTQEVTLTSWVPSWEAKNFPERPASMNERTLDITVRWPDGGSRRFGHLALRRVLELLFWKELHVQTAVIRPCVTDEPFYEDLGLHRGTDGRLYRQVGGILRHPVEETLEALGAETGQRLFDTDGVYAHVEDGRTVLDGDGVSIEPEFLLRHAAEQDSIAPGGWVAPIPLSLAQALEIFSAPELPDWATELVAEAASKSTPKSAGAYDYAAADGPPPWERDLLGLN